MCANINELPEVNSYGPLIRNHIRRRKDIPILNSSLEHVIVLYATMIKNANNLIRIYTSELNPKVYGAYPIVRAAQEFLSYGNKKIQIIVENVDSRQVSENVFVKSMPKKSSLEVYKASEQVVNEIPYHFFIMDEECYRFEIDKTRFDGVAGCDVEFSKELSRVFLDIIEDNSKSTIIYTSN